MAPWHTILCKFGTFGALYLGTFGTDSYQTLLVRTAFGTINGTTKVFVYLREKDKIVILRDICEKVYCELPGAINEQ